MTFGLWNCICITHRLTTRPHPQLNKTTFKSFIKYAGRNLSLKLLQPLFLMPLFELHLVQLLLDVFELLLKAGILLPHICLTLSLPILLLLLHATFAFCFLVTVFNASTFRCRFDDGETTSADTTTADGRTTVLPLLTSSGTRRLQRCICRRTGHGRRSGWYLLTMTRRRRVFIYLPGMVRNIRLLPALNCQV